MINKSLLHKPSGNIRCTSVCINMIGTVLRIILNYNNKTIVPNGTVAQVIHKHSYSQVIVSCMGKRRRPSKLQSLSMIVNEPY